MYDDIQELSTKIDKTGIHIDNLFQNLLSWSLIQQNKIGIQYSAFSPQEIIETLLPVYEQLLHEKKIIITKKFIPYQTISTDKNLFSLIARNLIDNAIKNSPIDSIIHIQTDSTETFHQLSIQNNSTISDEQFLNLQTFLDSTQEWQVGKLGIGLGLILIKEFVSKMQGSFKIDKLGDQITCMVVFPVIDNTKN